MLNLQNKILTSALMFATIATMLAMRYFDGFLTNETCANGIVSFEFSKNIDCAETILNSWDEKAKIAAGLSLGLDYLFLLLYSSTIALLIFRVAKNFKENKLGHNLGRILIWGIFLAAFFDSVENYALIKLLLGDLQEIWATIANIFATLKFVIIGFAVIYLIPCLIYFGLKKLK